MTGPKVIGKILSTLPIRNLLFAYAFRHPHKHLVDQNGSLYMGRWHLIDEYDYSTEHRWADSRGNVHTTPISGGRNKVSKLLQKLTGYWSARLHHINRPDHDRDLHNHPFEYRTFVVRGWYTEVYLNAQGVEVTRTIRAGQTVHSGGTFHRITAVSPGGVWTVFVMSKNTGKWGFRVRRAHGRYKFVESTEYFAQRGGNTA